MRKILWIAVPFVLTACGATVTKTGEGEAPAPAPLASDKPTATELAKVDATDVAGTWSEASGTKAAYTGEDGQTVFAVTCEASGDAAGNGNMLKFSRTVDPSSDARAIGIFTDAGAISVPATVDTVTGEISGAVSAETTAISALSVGEGKLRIAVDEQAYNIPNDISVKNVVDACRPSVPKVDDGSESEKKLH